MLLIYVAHTQRVSFRGLARLFVQDMIFQVPQLIVEITKIFTLEAGDLILTGTPEGVGPIQVDPQLSEGFFFVRSLSHTILPECLHKILFGERERERERARANHSHIWYMCFLKDVHVFSFTRRDWVDHGSPIPTEVFFHLGLAIINHQPSRPMFPFQAGDVVRAGIVGMSESEIQFDVAMDE